MIFQTKGAIDKIIRGEKTQTRRLVKPNQRFAGALAHAIPEVYTFNTAEGTNMYRSVYEGGQDYAVQPGRGKPTVWYMTPAMYEGGRGDQIAYAHTTKDTDSVLTLWQKAQTSIFHSTGKTNTRAYLQNIGFHELRIRITAIKREDVRNISDEDARAEGYLHRLDFLKAWVQMHNKRIQIESNPVYDDLCYVFQPKRPGACVTLTDLARWLDAVRPSEKSRYQAWALTFEVVS